MSMHRRDFLKQGSIALATPLFSSAVPRRPGAACRRPAGPDWDCHVELPALDRRGPESEAPAPERAVMTALDAPKFVRDELGLRQLEIIINHLDERTVAYAERVRAAADQAGVKFMNLQLGGQMSASDPAVREKSIEEIKEGMRIAAALGAPSVRADVGGKAGEPLDLAITADSYKQLVEFGTTIGVMPMPENHGGHSTNPDTLVSIMKAVDPRVRAIVDWGNFRVQNQAERIECTRKLLPYTGLVSAKVDRFDADYVPATTSPNSCAWWRRADTGASTRSRSRIRRPTSCAARSWPETHRREPREVIGAACGQGPSEHRGDARQHRTSENRPLQVGGADILEASDLKDVDVQQADNAEEIAGSRAPLRQFIDVPRQQRILRRAFPRLVSVIAIRGAVGGSGDKRGCKTAARHRRGAA